MYKKFLFLIFFNLIAMSVHSANFTLDNIKIEINSSFLGKEILLFGQKDEERDIIIIFEGEKQKAKLITKIKKGLFWINNTQDLSIKNKYLPHIKLFFNKYKIPMKK